MPEFELFYTDSEQFYITIGQLNNFESLTIVNILVNNAFKYQIKLNDKIILLITLALYDFNLSINSQYNDTEFKGFFINSRALTRSIEGIGQLKILQQCDISV